ncbi:hypothetical protein CLV63_1354 [Murinocardiopsis flavida]|uniref:Uncharacterized protein n=1 Tax=Murinocardiopsis flavida TaxID=645275 RepID=A0A2P8CMN7_9ACTN|nr:hypothetical protein CLV63_1354 [Murinocardiopsis flavida]
MTNTTDHPGTHRVRDSRRRRPSRIRPYLPRRTGAVQP